MFVFGITDLRRVPRRFQVREFRFGWCTRIPGAAGRGCDAHRFQRCLVTPEDLRRKSCVGIPREAADDGSLGWVRLATQTARELRQRLVCGGGQ